ncbi:MAG: carboxylesterase family protein [Proteobacteria bacterium]|nr:carboxylesterase family protein [Pseudomonadota bacterium]
MERRVRRYVSAGILVLVLVLATAAFLLRSSPSQLAEPIRVANGLIQGTRENGLTVYRGIPFAAPPVGQLRWQAPHPVDDWQGILKTQVFKPACPQIGASVPGMAVEPTNEDCLYLNIWEPDHSTTAKLPVMIWLYGGNNTNGSGSAQLYGGGQLAQKGVLVLTFNSRLGELGMLAHPQLSNESEHKVSGNYLLLDQIALLRWVQGNIAAFGGDPGNVTLFGQSAGAYNLSKLMVSPLAKGLFHRVIAESGGDFGPVDTSDGPPSLPTAEQSGIAFAAQLNATSIAALRQMSAAKIIAAPRPPGTGLNVDGYVSPKDTTQLYRDGQQAPVELLLGYTADDGALAGVPLNAQAFTAYIHKRYGDYSNRMLALYPASTDEEAKHSWVRFKTEEAFGWQEVTWARLHRDAGGRKTFLYIFSHVPPFGPYPRVGASHGAELAYVFGFLPNLFFYLHENPVRASRDVRLVHDIQTYWTNFAKTGDPNGEGVPKWPLFDAREQVLDIGDTIDSIDLPHREEHALMDAYMASVRNRIDLKAQHLQ